ncbi:MAG TPA: carboxypeptidase regulatory-like domain-containing protein, partial [Polyangiaceae bacterium]|nr:carboxypeptidase regulatory-like domain-containing protein [Polyangiaceae bacterium]
MRSGSGFSSLLAMGALLSMAPSSGCANGGSSADDGLGGNGVHSGTDGGGDGSCLTCGVGYTGGQACAPGLECHVQCEEHGVTTTISGTVYDPAGKNPLYGVTVYVPQKPLEPLPKGVPTGADACSCAALYKSGAVASTTTGVDGKFEIEDAPVGSKVPLVLQIGKWRRQVTIDVKACRGNPQPDRSLSLP